jgi:hypothetical protein
MSALEREPEEQAGDLAYVEIPQAGAPERWTRTLLGTGWKPDELTWDPQSPAGKFLRGMRTGATRKAAAAYANVSWERVRHWLAEGGRVWPDDEDEIPLMPDPERMYAVLLRWTMRLEGQVNVEVVDAWRQMAMEDWRAAEKFMARRFPEEWAPRTQVDVTGRIDVDTDDLAEAIFGGNKKMHELLSEVEKAVGAGGESRMIGAGPLEDVIDVDPLDD